MPDLRLDHIGIQVRDLLRTAEAFERLFGYRRVTDPVVNTRHGVSGVFLEKPDSIAIKLITPVTPGPHAYGLHHLAFMAPDLESTLIELGVAGARTLSPPQPGEMFDDELIAFVRAAGINVELITTDRRRARIE
ncbi:VOC family protein [Nocardioides sp. YIM B13467]|uniref:VOC family protein n=1 Tax=Nocardioides sp. YIM B13467 TaxID=3366294 RepID=UPI00366D3E38